MRLDTNRICEGDVNWELARHDWVGLGAPLLPEWVSELLSGDDAERANELLSLIEAEVIPPNGPMKPAAAAAASCLVQGLLSASSVGKGEVLYLLFQLAGGVVSDVQLDLSQNVKREIELGLPIYAEIAETAASPDVLQCIDLLSMCARFDEYCLQRCKAVLLRIAELGEKETSLVGTEFEDLKGSGFMV